MLIIITSPVNGVRFECKTRKEAASYARCSAGRIGEILKTPSQSATLRNGYKVEVAVKLPFWSNDSKAPHAEAVKVAELIKKNARYNDDYSIEPGAITYEAWKEYFAEALDCEFAQQVMDILD